MRNENETNCGQENELLSYLYEDGTADSREGFEMHLADCEVCTDEFAAVSLARFSVYEWHKEEFVPLPTPQIVIPYEEKPVSIWAGLREAFSFNWATASLAVASLLVVAVLGSVYVSNRSGSQETAATDNSNVVSAPNPVNIDLPKPTFDTKSDTGIPIKTSSGAPVQNVRNERTTQAKRDLRRDQATVRTDAKRLTVASTNNKPSLTAIDDDSEDDSLRLSDLLDAEDTRL